MRNRFPLYDVGSNLRIFLQNLKRCNFVLQSALNCLNLKWQVVEHVGQGLKRPFWKLTHLICKNDEALRKARVLACRFDTLHMQQLCIFSCSAALTLVQVESLDFRNFVAPSHARAVKEL